VTSSQIDHILVVEPELSGHQSDHVRHLVRYWVRERPFGRLSFLVHPGFTDRFPDIVELAAGSPAPVLFCPMSSRQHTACVQGNLIRRGFALWRYGLAEGLRRGADHVHFLAMDHLQLPLALGRSSPGAITLSGVLFRPSVHYAALWPESAPLRSERLRDRRKQITYRRMLRHPSLRVIFSLDPVFPYYAREHLPEGDRVTALPEPYEISPADRSASPAAWLSDLPDDRLRFVLFGALQARKGVIQLLEALARLTAAEHRRMAVILAGRLEGVIRESVGRQLARLRTRAPDLSVHLEDRFIPEPELHQLVTGADVILAPYQRFVGSSGVVVLSAAAGKPVITQSYGLVGALTREYRLGLAVDTTDPSALAGALKRAVCEPDRLCDRHRLSEFARQHTPERFAAVVFTALEDHLRRDSRASG